MSTRINLAGLVIAAIGFFLTRFTVTLAAYETPMRFYLAGIVPLVLGLGLSAVGVALAVADFDRAFVRTIATWCVLGAASMFVLVVLTILGEAPGTVADAGTIRSQSYLSTFLIGGSVGGTLTGMYAARARSQRATLRHQASRLKVLNRMVRHEVLNAVTVIQAYTSIERTADRDPSEVIATHAHSIQHTVEDVKFLARSERTHTDIDLTEPLATSLETIRDRHPAANVTVEMPSAPLLVRADDRLSHVFTELLDNAIVYADAAEPRVTYTVTETPSAVRVSITDEGTGLPENQRDLLERGEIERFDDPTTGFGLNIVRLLLENYGGTIETDTGPAGTTITMELSRTTHADRPTPFVGTRPSVPHLVVTLAAALVAGLTYGIVAEALGGSVGVIGVFYGVEDPIVGWITHEFHSVVFGFAFAGIVAVAPPRIHGSILGYVAIGVGWALVLWFIAAGLIAPIWLRLLGIPAGIPNLSASILASHLAWGVTLGLLTSLCHAHVTPRLADRIDVLQQLEQPHVRD